MTLLLGAHMQTNLKMPQWHAVKEQTTEATNNTNPNLTSAGILMVELKWVSSKFCENELIICDNEHSCDSSYMEHYSSRPAVNLLKPTGHVMHHQFNIQQLYALPTLYLCVLYLS